MYNINRFGLQDFGRTYGAGFLRIINYKISFRKIVNEGLNWGFPLKFNLKNWNIFF